MSFLSNPITYLFDSIEESSGIQFASFTANETPKTIISTGVEQPLMKLAQDKRNRLSESTGSDLSLYKYLYDPALDFSWRFHQRLANIQYSDRSNNWVSLMFNTSEATPHTQVGSLVQRSHERTPEGSFEVFSRKVSVPVNLVFISNDKNYLYGFVENISFYFDRLINFKYNQTIKYSPTYTQNYEQSGLVTDIKQVDLDKLETQTRGSLVTAAYTFNMVYWVHTIPQIGNILEEINVNIKVLDGNAPIFLTIK